MYYHFDYWDYEEGCGYLAESFRACIEDMYVETIEKLHRYWVDKDNKGDDNNNV